MEPLGDKTSQNSAITVREALQTLAALNQDLILLDYADVIVQKGYPTSKNVRLLSGGVGTSDLFQPLLVGKGMLTAAILSEDSVPTSRQILRTIKELNQGENCGIFILLQKNNDLFNFALATERANLDSYTRVKILLIDDDKGTVKERYSCGVIFLIKILGALAEEGALFEDICKLYEQLFSNITTIDLEYILDDFGPKHKKVLLSPVFEQQITHLLVKKSSQDDLNKAQLPIVALLNFSKSLDNTTLELGVLKTVIEKFKTLGFNLVRIYYGNFLKHNHKSATLTILKVTDPKILSLLNAPCEAFGWRNFKQYQTEISVNNEYPGILKSKGKQAIEIKGPKLEDHQSKILIKAIQFACDALISCERQLNIIDSEKSGGTVGTRLKKLAEHLNFRINSNQMPIDCPYTFLKKLSLIAETVIGGTMGSIYGIFLDCGANIFGGIPETEVVSPLLWSKALSAGCDSIQRYCSEENMTKTMFFALKSCEKVVCNEMRKNEQYLNCFGAGVSMAEEAAQKTRQANDTHPDAGAHAVGIWMRAIFEGVKIMRS